MTNKEKENEYLKTQFAKFGNSAIKAFLVKRPKK